MKYYVITANLECANNTEHILNLASTLRWWKLTKKKREYKRKYFLLILVFLVLSLCSFVHRCQCFHLQGFRTESLKPWRSTKYISPNVGICLQNYTATKPKTSCYCHENLKSCLFSILLMQDTWHLLSEIFNIHALPCLHSAVLMLCITALLYQPTS
jgi:hypothetical protein